MKNFGGLTVNEYIYDADEVDSALLEEMAKYLIDKPNTFRDIGRHQQSMREFTRQARQTKEVSYVNAPASAAEDEDEDDKSAGFFGRLKSILS